MATISSLGVGSGLDLTTLLANITKNEQLPLGLIQQQQTSYNTKLSAYGQLGSALSALQTAAAALALPSLFQGMTSTSSAPNVLTATALSTAVSGNATVNVTQLAQAQSLAAAGVATTTGVIGGGAATTVTLDFGTITGGTLNPATGTYTGATFTADATRAATTITINATNNTLAGIRDAINASTAIGVTASIVNNGSALPNQLVLTSKTTGATSSMRIAVAGDATLTSLLAYNPAAVQNLQQTAIAQDAKLNVNGIAVTSASNTVTGALQGVTMNLASVGTSTLSVQSNTASTQTAITTFVNAYNSLQSVVKSLTAYNPTSKTAAPLLGDSTLQGIQTRIRSTLSAAQAPVGGLTTLSQIGLSFQLDGSLLIDSAKLTTALSSNLSGVTNLFSGAAGVGGYANQLASQITGFSNIDGALTVATAGINKSLTALGKQYSDKSAQIDATVARYKAQFTQLDKLISSMNQTSSYLTQQFAALNSTTK